MRVPKPARLEQHQSGIYYLHWREGGKPRQQSTGTRSREDAERVLSAWNEKAQAQLDAANATKISNILDAYWTSWAQDTASAATTLSHIKRLKEAFGFHDIRDLTLLDIQTYIRKRRKGRLGPPVGDGTLRRELTIFVAAINHAVNGRVIPRDAAPTIPMPPRPAARERYLEKEEIDRLIETAAKTRDGERLSRVERFIWIALQTGARKDAIIKLTWDRVDFTKRLIDFRDPALPITKKRRATVPISDSLLPVLERAFRERKGAYVLDTTGQLRSAFERTVKLAGLGDDVIPHTLRHTWATHASMNGVQLLEIARVLGNTVGVVESVYAKHQPEYLRQAVNSAYGKPKTDIEERAP